MGEFICESLGWMRDICSVSNQCICCGLSRLLRNVLQWERFARRSPASVLGFLQDVVTPLDEYVFSDDGAYSFEELVSYRYNGVTVYVYNMTSQIWFDGTNVLECAKFLLFPLHTSKADIVDEGRRLQRNFWTEKINSSGTDLEAP